MLKRLLAWVSNRSVPASTGASTLGREDMPAIKARMCSLAERIAKESYGIRLDYSPASIERVEEILASIHNDFRKTGSTDGLKGIALEFGAYTVTVIEMHFGPAVWKRDHPEFGKDSFPLHWQGSTIFPFGWCEKRIMDGPGDNVWTKFQELVLRRTRKK
jgi:hypothetical protein